MSRPDSSRGRPITAEAPAELAGSPTGEPTPRVAEPAPQLRSASHAGGGLRLHGVVAQAAREPRPVAVTVWRRVDAGLVEAFEVVVPIELARVFRGYGPLPAVTGTEGEAGRWGSADGQSRTVLLADGGRLRETVLHAAEPGLFRYEVVPERGALRLLVRGIEGRFVFSASEAGGTVIRWTYVFRPRRGAGLAVRALARLWHRYATESLDRVAEIVAAGAPASGAGAARD